MMDWQQLRQQWQGSGDAMAAPDATDIARLEQRDRALRAQVQRRDRLETGVALAMAMLFAGIASVSWTFGAQGAAGFAALLVAWALVVPWCLWRARRRLPEPRHDLPSLAYLREQHAGLLAQARLLEQVWWWYLAPCAIGVIGFVVALTGPTWWSLVYAATVLVFYAVIARWNLRAARDVFRTHAADVARQIESFGREQVA